jgi:pilus assembly protein FimV
MNLKAIQRLAHASMAGLLSLAVTPVLALGLGSMDLQSRLNQSFQADIPVLVPAETDPTELSVQLAADHQFEREGLKRGRTVMQMKFNAVRREDGQMVIEVTTPSRVVEPMLSFVLEVEQGGMRTMRKYTAMLEAPTR